MAGKMQLNYPLHPRLKKLYPMLKQKFEEIIIGDHNLLSLEEHRNKFLSYLPDTESQKIVKTKWSNMGNASGMELWQVYQDSYRSFIEQKLNEARQ